MALRIIVSILGVLVSKEVERDFEKITPFECGFAPKFSARLPFSIRFFLLALIFLIFDVELVLIFPYILNITRTVRVLNSGLLIIFLLVLLIGIFHEWNQGMLDWSV